MNKFPSQLVKRTRELYQKHPRHISDREICRVTGLSPSWLSEFVNGKIEQPSPGKVEALYNYLSSTPLKV